MYFSQSNRCFKMIFSFRENVIQETMSHCQGVLAPVELAFSTTAVSIFFSLLTTPGNLLICLSVFINPYNNLRTPFNYFIVNLALADLTVGLITEPMSAVYHYREGLRLDFADLQKVHHYLYFTTCTASIFSLGALTAERYTAAASTESYRAKTSVSSKKYVLTSVVIWVVSLLISGIYFKVGPMLQSIVFTVTAIAATFVILTFTYQRIFSVLRTHSSEHKARIKKEGAQRKNAQRALKVIEREKKLTRVFALILICYMCCFIPACVLIFMMNFCEICSCEIIHWFRDVQFWFVLLNSVINPYLYALRIPYFKRAIAYILRCRFESPRVSDLTSVNSQSYTQNNNSPRSGIPMENTKSTLKVV